MESQKIEKKCFGQYDKTYLTRNCKYCGHKIKCAKTVGIHMTGKNEGY
jgi:hypothetical protein